MQVDIKSISIKPQRNTFDQVARFTGNEKPASRYLEATIGIQPEVNFHYQPLWSKDRAIYDKRNTAVVMNDWYRLLDPRQYYYGAWTIARSRQQEGAERNFAFVEKRGVLGNIPADLRSKINFLLLPLRHVEYGANLNNAYISAYGYGVSITQATMMCAMDRLGIAQYITRIGLVLDNGDTTALKQAKTVWHDDPAWQGMRELVENMLVTKDWFELFVAQNVVLDSLLYPLVYQSFGDLQSGRGHTGFALLTEFMSDWFEEHQRWTTQVMKIAAAESEENKTLLQQWVQKWQSRVEHALQPLMQATFEDHAQAELDACISQFETRMANIGL